MLIELINEKSQQEIENLIKNTIVVIKLNFDWYKIAIGISNVNQIKNII